MWYFTGLPCDAVPASFPARREISISMRCLPVLIAAAGFWFPSTGVAAELLPAETAVEAAIDHYIRTTLADRRIAAASRADEATLLRRWSLDLAGRVPALAEFEAFQRMSPSERPVATVDRLLASPDAPFHLRNELDVLLLPENKSSDEWRQYLWRACQENRPWDRMFSEMLIGKDDDPAAKGATQYLRARATELDDITNETSRLFFGVAISCAKCHDHPLVDDWKQDHYFGLASFFNRLYVTRSRKVGERTSGEIRFKTTKGLEKPAKVMFLTGTVIDEPALDRTAEQNKAEDELVRKLQQNDEQGLPPEPEFSRLRQLVDVALRDENQRFFARSIVNRIWERLLGRGLVHPVDQMHSGNPASHPELLDWLERDLVLHGYDLRRLIRGIVLSEAYARASAWHGAGEVPDPEWYAVAATRPLTPRQLSLSLLIAAMNPRDVAAAQSDPAWAGRRQQLENQSFGLARELELPGENFQVGVSEALLFSNSERIQNEYLRDSGDRLVSQLKGLPSAEAVPLAFRVVLARQPDAAEQAAFSRYLQDRSERPVPATQQLVWALLTSPEFRFNH